MTVIVYRDGVLAADSQTTCGWSRAGLVKKITKTTNGCLVGTCGSAADAEIFTAWVAAGEPAEPPKFPGRPSFSAYVVRPDGRLFRADDSIGLYLIRAPFHAMGCGGETALGALEMGASAEQAVRAAIKHNAGCGGPVRVERLKPAKKKAKQKR